MSDTHAQADIFDRQALIAEIERGMAFTYAHFQDQTEEDDGIEAVLNPWRQPAAFTLKGITYPTAEHHIMAEKARLFGDETTRKKILAAPSPDAVKALGRQVADFVNDKWEQHRFDIVVRGFIAKFGQNQPLKTYLLEPCNKVLVEAAPRDTIWAVGLARDDERILDPRTWRGENLLGCAQMKACTALRDT